MFTSIKDKLITNVSKINLLTTTTSPLKQTQEVRVNLNAGAEVLTHFQKSWQELHETNEYNAKNAALVAENICKMHDTIASDHSNITKIIDLMNTPPLLKTTIETALNQVKILHSSFERVEKGLVDLEELIEELDFQKAKVEYVNMLVAQREKEKAERHAQSLLEEDIKQRKVAEERQMVFGKAFHNDIETYKMLGEIPKIEAKIQPCALLEEIQLDLDDKDLESFLNEQ